MAGMERAGGAVADVFYVGGDALRNVLLLLAPSRASSLPHF